MAISDRFAPYDFVDYGVCVIAHERSSTIVYCNRHFASLLSTKPESLKGRSLDEITKSGKLHYDQMQPLLTKHAFAISFLGGFIAQVYDQMPNSKKIVRTLKVSRVEKDHFDGETYLIGYVRRPTRLELALNKLRLDTSLDPLWHPVANFFLAGRWRPLATLTAPLWMPALVEHSPQLVAIIEQILAS
jgi:hypothetical protein